MAVKREDFPAFGNLKVIQHRKIRYLEKYLSLGWNEQAWRRMFLLSPNKAHVGDEFEVQSHMFGLALTGLKCRVHGASESSFCHHQTITLKIQVTLEGEWWKRIYVAKSLLRHQLAIPLPFYYRWSIQCDNIVSLTDLVLQKMFDIPSIFPSSLVTVIPTGAKISLSFPLSPFSARTLSIDKIKHT